MKEKKLIPLLQFILDLDASRSLGSKGFNGSDMHRYEAVIKYTKFLNTSLVLDMFIPNIGGEIIPKDHPDYKLHQDAIVFKGFKTDVYTFNQAVSVSHESGVNVFWRDNPSGEWRLSVGLKTVNDLVRFSLTYIEK